MELGCKINVYDPEAMPNVKAILGDKVTFSKNPYEAIDQADALLIVTEWPQFRAPDFEQIAKLMKRKVIFDGRNLFDLESIEAKGFDYISIGRKQVLINK